MNKVKRLVIDFKSGEKQIINSNFIENILIEFEDNINLTDNSLCVIDQNLEINNGEK